MKTYTITTYAGREIAKNVGVDELNKFIPMGYKAAGSSTNFPLPNQLMQKKVGDGYFEALVIVEDKKQ